MLYMTIVGVKGFQPPPVVYGRGLLNTPEYNRR